MQSILGSVTQGVSRTGVRMLVAAQEKMGKTTFVSGAPGVLLVPLEVGYAGVSVAKTGMMQTLPEFYQLLDEITYYAQRGELPYKTIAIDSATALERMIHDQVLKMDPAYKPTGSKTNTMEASHGGYGKAYNVANNLFTDILARFDQLAVYGGLNILLTCHVFSSVVQDPTVGEYSTWDLLLHSPKNQKTYGKREIITQWADVVGFLHEPVFTSTAEGSKMTRAVTQGKGRVMGLSRTPSYTAGNRFGMLGELALPAPPANSWNVFADTLYKQSGIDLYTR